MLVTALLFRSRTAVRAGSNPKNATPFIHSFFPGRPPMRATRTLSRPVVVIYVREGLARSGSRWAPFVCSPSASFNRPGATEPRHFNTSLDQRVKKLASLGAALVSFLKEGFPDDNAQITSLTKLTGKVNNQISQSRLASDSHRPCRSENLDFAGTLRNTNLRYW